MYYKHTGWIGVEQTACAQSVGTRNPEIVPHSTIWGCVLAAEMARRSPGPMRAALPFFLSGAANRRIYIYV